MIVWSCMTMWHFQNLIICICIIFCNHSFLAEDIMSSKILAAVRKNCCQEEGTPGRRRLDEWWILHGGYCGHPLLSLHSPKWVCLRKPPTQFRLWILVFIICMQRMRGTPSKQTFIFGVMPFPSISNRHYPWMMECTWSDAEQPHLHTSMKPLATMLPCATTIRMQWYFRSQYWNWATC